MKNRKIALILGTRPEIIKLSPIIRRLERARRDYFIIHTGQHYSFELDRQFFKDLRLPRPRYRLNIHSHGVTLQAEHTGRMLVAIERILLKEMPGTVLVQGDTNSVLAGALTVSKLVTTRAYTRIDIRLAHVEAGLRSYDRSMPEEINRFITDHFSDSLFAPTKQAADILIREGVPKDRVFVTGNTIVDAVNDNLKLAVPSSALKRLAVRPRQYALLTLHRQENVDNPARLRLLLEGIGRVGRALGREIIFPVHPRAAKKIAAFRLKLPAGVRTVKPLGFLDFLSVESQADLLLTDSGGVQEEGCILGVPCVTLRESTERPETVAVGANVIAGYQPEKVLGAALRMIGAPRGWKNPLGDGRASERILRIVDRRSPP